MKRTALIAADGFEEVEGLTVVDLLRRADLVCDIVALSDRKKIIGSHDIRVSADKAFSSTDFSSYDAVILPGGLRGTKALLADNRVKELLQFFYREGRLTAAVCAAPSVLGAAGLLQGKKAVCYPGIEDRLIGAEVCFDPVMQDGTVITSRGLGTSIPFALQIIAYLEGRETADRIDRKIVVPGLASEQP